MDRYSNTAGHYDGDGECSYWQRYRKRQRRVTERIDALNATAFVSSISGQCSSEDDCQEDPEQSTISDRPVSLAETPEEEDPEQSTISDRPVSLAETPEEDETNFRSLQSIEKVSDESSDSESDDESLIFNNSREDLKTELRDWATEFNICHKALSSLLHIIQPYHPEIPLDPRTLLETNVSMLDIRSVGDGIYHHFGMANGLQKLMHTFELPSCADQISLLVNVDGLPLFKSSATVFWPILASLYAPLESEPFIVGLFCGDKKPDDVHLYLKDFVEEMRLLEETGFDWNGQVVGIHISGFVCDTPARAFIKQVKGHCGYSGCDKCYERGVWCGKVVFPGVSAPLRTDVLFDEMEEDDEHRLGSSPLQVLSVGMVSSFPLDFMHLVCMGVTKKLLLLWVRGMPGLSGIKIGPGSVAFISNMLKEFRSFIPREFNRRCRSLLEVERWKASELRLFVLYVGIVALKGSNIKREFYDHFLLLFVAIYCLASPKYCLSHCDFAAGLLKRFVVLFGRLYGLGNVTYNVHGLIHLPLDVRRFGPLDSYSAFPFENYLGRLKKLVRRPKFPLQQVVRRLSENSMFSKITSSNRIEGPKKPHQNGPIPRMMTDVKAFEEIVHGGMFLSLSSRDDCIKFGAQYAVIKNIICDSSGKLYILFEEFLRISNFFDSPLPSRDLDIVLASGLSGFSEVLDITLIDSKCMRLPYGNEFVLIPLLHHS